MTGDSDWIITPRYVLARENAVLWGWHHEFNAALSEAMRKAAVVTHRAAPVQP